MTNPEFDRLRLIRDQWVAAREAEDYTRADRLRRYLENAGCLPPDYERWHAVFETSAHRARRCLKELK